MKCFYALVFLIFFMSCSSITNSQKPNFLLGHWKRLNDYGTKKTFESWKADFTGIGYTLQGRDTIFKELLSIVSLRDSSFLKVVGVNENPTYFKFTTQTENSFICENPKNEFPKKIRYWKEKDTLKAKVWNPGGTELMFKFMKD